MSKEFIIENLNDDEISRLFKSDTSIEWGIDDLDRTDIVVYSESSVYEIMLIIGRGLPARTIFNLLVGDENIDVIRQSDSTTWYTIYRDSNVDKHCGDTISHINICDLEGPNDFIIYYNPFEEEDPGIRARKRRTS